jgi:ketosteroid isomerase-like protein
VKAGRSNLEIADAANRTFNEHGVDAVAGFYTDDMEWRMPHGWMEQSVYRGHQGLRELAGAWSDQFDDYRWDQVDLIEVDSNRVLGLYVTRGNIKGSGLPVELSVGLVLTFDEGLIRRADTYFSWDEAREAVGVEARD